SKKLTWKIFEFTKVFDDDCVCLYSKIFLVGDFSWKIIFHPKKGKEVNDDHLMLCLDASVDSAILPNGWSIYAEFSLAVVNQINAEHSI
ncbi:hypothetical protein CFOL_v3_29555, partial [Cephalotus follicularis]